MARPKALYLGDGAGKMPRKFSDKLKKTIRDFYPNQDADTDPTFGHPADEFVNEVLAEVRWAADELISQKLAITKQDLRAELADLLNTLESAQEKLRNLSPDVDLILGIDADPLGVADSLDALITQVSAANTIIDEQQQKDRLIQIQHDIAVEMAFRVFHVLQASKVPVPTTSGSVAMRILAAVGNEIGLRLADSTWLKIIAKAKKSSLY